MQGKDDCPDMQGRNEAINNEVRNRQIDTQKLADLWKRPRRSGEEALNRRYLPIYQNTNKTTRKCGARGREMKKWTVKKSEKLVSPSLVLVFTLWNFLSNYENVFDRGVTPVNI
eukprot:g15526.t1